MATALCDRCDHGVHQDCTGCPCGCGYAGLHRSRAEKIQAAIVPEQLDQYLPAASPHCDWCGTAIFPDFERNWHDRHGDFRCPEVSEDHTDHAHEPAASRPPT